MTDHLIRYGVVLRDSNLDADAPGLVFDCVSGAGAAGVYAFVERNIEPGTIIGAIESVPDSFDQTIKLYEVMADGPLNLLDEQPVVGDTVTSVCPPSDIVFQAGMNAVFVDDDGHVATISIGLLLALFPLFAQDWLSQVPGMLTQALGALDVPAQVQQALASAGVGDGGVRTVAYTVFPTPENLAGTSLTAWIPDGTGGGLVERTLTPGDTVACITGFRDDVPYGCIAELRVVTALPEDGADPISWPLADRQIRQGDLFITTGADLPSDNVGLIAIAPFDGVMMAAQANVITRIIDELAARVGTLEAVEVGEIPGGATAPSHATPMENWTWDGTDNVLVSADTSNQPITISVPPAEDIPDVDATDDTPMVPGRKVINHTLIVQNRNGGNDVTIAINAAEDHQGDIIVPPGHVATIRAIYGSYVLVTWL